MAGLLAEPSAKVDGTGTCDVHEAVVEESPGQQLPVTAQMLMGIQPGWDL